MHKSRTRCVRITHCFFRFFLTAFFFGYFLAENKPLTFFLTPPLYRGVKKKVALVGSGCEEAMELEGCL